MLQNCNTDLVPIWTYVILVYWASEVLFLLTVIYTVHNYIIYFQVKLILMSWRKHFLNLEFHWTTMKLPNCYRGISDLVRFIFISLLFTIFTAWYIYFLHGSFINVIIALAFISLMSNAHVNVDFSTKYFVKWYLQLTLVNKYWNSCFFRHELKLYCSFLNLIYICCISLTNCDFSRLWSKDKRINVMRQHIYIIIYTCMYVCI